MLRNTPQKPLLVFDGDCSFCRHWIERWKSVTGDRVAYEPFHAASERFPEIPLEAFKHSVQLILPSGEVASAAHAVFKTLAFAPGEAWMLWCYKHVPAFALISEWVYRIVAAHRDFFYKLTRLLWGRRLEPPRYFLTREVFLRLLGVVYFFAFLSFATQITGLIGQDGLLPAGRFLRLIRANFGASRYWLVPTLAWLDSSDAFLHFLCVGGTLGSIPVILGVTAVPLLALLWVFYLSLVGVGQAFLSFQWDILLLETGFLAMLWAPMGARPFAGKRSPPSRAVLWLLRLLLFRLMFSSGAVKVLSHDPAWHHLTALQYHYETQPLPTPIAWYMAQLPAWFHQCSVVVMFAIELGVPFLIFAPRRLRFLGAGALISLQVLIGLTDNYCYFNLLTIALCLGLFDDAALERVVPSRFAGSACPHQPDRHASPVRRLVVVPLAVAIVAAGAVQIAALFTPRDLPRPAYQLLGWMQPLHLVNSYGLFAVMTTSRVEIVIEGSNDGEHWQAYEFKYKPGDLRRAPPWVEPFQPRLDWQMWFAALGSYRATGGS